MPARDLRSIRLLRKKAADCLVASTGTRQTILAFSLPDASQTEPVCLVSRSKFMPRIAMASAVVVTFISFGAFSAFAQSPSPKSKFPGEIAAASRLLAEKQENCRLEAKQQKLAFLKRRRFVRECIKKKP